MRIKQFNKDSMSNNRCGACFRLRISFMNKATESRRYKRVYAAVYKELRTGDREYQES